MPCIGFRFADGPPAPPCGQGERGCYLVPPHTLIAVADPLQSPPDATIRFYLAKAAFGFLSNFARSPIVVDATEWGSVEHFYQAHKFIDLALREQVRCSPTPLKAAKLARAHRSQVRADWDDAKESVMLTGLRAKFRQHPDLAAALLATGTARLIEHTHLDTYWADGGDGTGRNRLGILLEQIRSELRLDLPPET